jgi:hypothetical protein
MHDNLEACLVPMSKLQRVAACPVVLLHEAAHLHASHLAVPREYR